MRGRVWLLLAASAAFGQNSFGVDERRVVSPDGQIVFRIAVAPQEDYALSRLAYQVDYRGKRLIETSSLGIDLWDQEPILGENTGLVSFAPRSTAPYNSAVASYMQNGSLGRRLDVEIRAYNEGVAFRYAIQKSAGVRELLIADEATEFILTHPTQGPLKMPYFGEEPGVGWLLITEAVKSKFPAMHLVRTGPSTYLSRLDRGSQSAKIAYAGATPFVLPWRVLAIGPDEKCVRESKLPQLLQQ